MDIVQNWLAGLPAMPQEDEFGCPWELCKRRGMTPAQRAFFQALATQQPAPIQNMQEHPMVYRNGVVDDHFLYYMPDGEICKKTLPTIEHAGDLLRLCLETGLESIWVLAGSQISDRATHDFIAQASDWEIKNEGKYAHGSGYTDELDRATYARAWMKREYRPKRTRGGLDYGREVCLSFPEHNTSYNFDSITSPVALLAALTYLEDAIGIPARFSAQTVGKRLMQEENEKHPAWVTPVKDLPAPCLTPVSGILWDRPLLPEEQNGYMGTADKNSMYPAACTSAFLGEEYPIHRDGAEIDKLLTGIYSIEISGESIFDGNLLPHPTNGVLRGWFWTYTVKLLQDLGYQVEIKEAWIWEKAHTVLRSWAERLWNARVSLKADSPESFTRYTYAAGRQAAEKACKGVLNNSIGMLAHYPDYPDRAGAFDWYRPDWNALIIDRARAAMFYLMKKLWELYQIAPFAVYEDCFYFAVPTNDLTQALPDIYARAGALGGFKPKYHKTIWTKQIAPLFAQGLHIKEINDQYLLRYDRGEIELPEDDQFFQQVDEMTVKIMGRI